jgi:hypothetical protein
MAVAVMRHTRGSYVSVGAAASYTAITARSLFKTIQIHDVSILWNTEFMIIFYSCNYEERIN